MTNEISLTERELNTVIAALRLLASSSYPTKYLSPAEIEALCERIKWQPPKRGMGWGAAID